MLAIDATQALKDAENSLRDFVALVLSSQRSDWIEHCGVAPGRVERWRARKVIEEKRQEAGAVDERLIYYADFYDLQTILKNNWSGVLSSALGDWKTFEVYLSELEKVRDADAHRRELLPHQKHLILGISGEIRNRIVRYRSKMETPDDCFPRIESARDSLGNIWVPTDQNSIKAVHTEAVLRPGDILEFVVTATDPEGLALEYAVGRAYERKCEWQPDPQLRFVIQESDIGRLFALEVRILSPREYHATSSTDDYVTFTYSVLPAKAIKTT
jgi:hypothetical protein